MLNPLDHPDDCTCEWCQDWRDVQLGIAALQELKRAKQPKQQLPAKKCEYCGRTKFPIGAVSCPSCGALL